MKIASDVLTWKGMERRGETGSASDGSGTQKLGFEVPWRNRFKVS